MEPNRASSQITLLLQVMAEQTGDARKETYDELVTVLYAELKHRAKRQLRGERADSLHPTRLVHEMYDRMLTYSMPYKNREHFLNVAASAMRRILIDRARRMAADKRGSGEMVLPLEGELDVATTASPELLLAIDQAMRTLSPEQVKLVELRFFAGYTMEQTAQIVGTKLETLKKRWQVVKTLLYDALAPSE